jgi:hypothetical protein
LQVNLPKRETLGLLLRALLHHLYITGDLEDSAKSGLGLTEVRQKKIAVIGAPEPRYESREVRVECLPWNRLKKITNLSDYDTIILDLLSLEDPSKLDGSTFRKVLDVRTAQQVLSKTGGAIYVLGNPRFTTEWKSEGVRQEGPFLAWTGIEFSWDDRPGTTVERQWEANREPFKLFADKLVRWNYSLAECCPDLREYAKVWDLDAIGGGIWGPSVAVNLICENSYGNALVFSVAHAVGLESEGMQAARSRRSSFEVLSGPVYFLPQSELSEEATLEFVLRELCGVDVSAPEPEWVSQLVAPGQEEVDHEIAELEVPADTALPATAADGSGVVELGGAMPGAADPPLFVPC